MPDIYSGHNAYLAAVENEIWGEVLAYINGEFSSLDRSIQLHIVSDEDEETPEDPDDSVRSTQSLYMDGGPFPLASPLSDSVLAYMLGSGMESWQLLYINTSGASLGSADCFVVGEEDHVVRDAIRFRSSLQQYVVIPDNHNYDYLNRWTVNLWVKPRTDSNFVRQGIFVKPGVIEMWVHPVGNSFGMRANIGGIWYEALTLSFTRDMWHMLTIMHDGSGIHFFMNGTEFYGINAPGELTSNNEPIYLGRYPEYDTYSDVDMCDVKMWNYNLSNAEIAEMWQPQARRSCVGLYLCVNDSTNVESQKRSYIYSDSDPSNPFVFFTSQPAGFAEAYSVGTKGAYVSAGGETETVFDTRFVTDHNTYTSWDNIIMVRGNQVRVNELQLGSIVYPITRDARRQVRIPTSYDPLSDRVWVDGMIHTHFSLEGSRLAHVVAPDTTGTIIDAFISGPFTAIDSTIGAYVVNNESYSNVGAYIGGRHVFSYDWSTPLFVNGFVESIVDSLPVMMYGRGEELSGVMAYVPAPGFDASRKDAFVMSVVNVVSESKRLYMRANIRIERNTNAYLYGHYAGDASVGSYIVAVPTIESSVGCFMQSENPHYTRRHSHISSHESISSSKLIHLKAEVHEVGSRAMYVAGIDRRWAAAWSYLVGPTTTSVGGMRWSYIANGLPTSTKFAFIVSAPQSTHQCYIVSSGSRSRVKSAFIAA